MIYDIVLSERNNEKKKLVETEIVCSFNSEEESLTVALNW